MKRTWMNVIFVLAFVLAGAGASYGQATTESAAEQVGDSELRAMLEKLTPEELTALLEKAAMKRLEVERDLTAAEIRRDVSYEKADRDAALAILAAEPAAKTQKENIERICRAFAAADADFAAAYGAFRDSKFDVALTKSKELLDERSATYLSAATFYLNAESIFALGRYEDAVDVYKVILVNMADRGSFAASSASRSAEAYEQAGRMYYAMQMYAHAIQEYGLTMPDAELTAILNRLKELQDIYKDPMGAVAHRMEQVKQRLAASDSDDATRQEQKQIVSILEDLIKTAEEQQQSSQSQQQQQQQQQSQKNQQQEQQQATVQGQTGTPKTPTTPAARSWLPGGEAARPPALRDNTGSKDGDENFSRLPPSEREKVDEAVRKLLPGAYRQLIRDYRTNLSQDNRVQEENPPK